MIQVYKKNELFIIENTVTDIIYPNLTREEALVLLEKFNINEPEDRCDFAIKEDNISFEYVSLDDKDKTIDEINKEFLSAIRDWKQLVEMKKTEIEQLKQQLHDLPKKIVKEIINNADLQSFDYGERYCEEEASNDWAIDLEDLKEILDTILKKYGG